MTQSSSSGIGLHADGAVLWMTFRNPAKHNALSMGMVEKALDAVCGFNEREDRRVLVLAGEGDSAFVSGADISEFEKDGNTDGAERRYSDLTAGLFKTIAGSPKPTIAMIHGYCFGGGVALAAACDLRYAADDASFSIPAAKLGIAYSVTFAKWVVDLVGPAVAREMLYSGRRYDSGEAERLGLVNRVYAKADLESEVAGLAATIAGNAPLSIRATKQTIRHLLQEGGAEDRETCEALIGACATSEDFTEGRNAFAEKRKPIFKGR